MQVQGFSHVTVAVHDLDTSLSFYVDVLHMRLSHKGRMDAYLEWGAAWLCLLQRPERSAQHKSLGVDHVAFYIAPERFDDAVAMLHEYHVPIVRGPIQRGIGWSVNFLDPDGTELELHTSTLQERLKVWK